MSEDLSLLENDVLADFEQQEESSKQVNFFLSKTFTVISISQALSWEIIKMAVNSRNNKSIRRVLENLERCSDGVDVLDSGPSISFEERNQHFQAGDTHFQHHILLSVLPGSCLVCYNQ